MENNLTDNYINNLFEFNKKSLLSKYRYMHHFSYIRELMICNDKLEILPEEIGNFNNLERLYIENCKNLKELPKEIGKLSNIFSRSMLL